MIEEALQNIPEEQRGLYKEMLKQQLATADSSEKTAPDWEKLKSTGKTVTIAGYNAVQYVTEEEDGSTYEVWCGTEVNMTEVKDFFENIGKISFFKDIMQNFSALNLGFPLKSVYKKDDSEYASEVTSIHFEKIPLSFFEVPEGYTTTESEISK